MAQSNDKMAALIGSRICHDLISPVGAVANGLELLEMSGVPRGPELSLVTESASNASARIRLFRLAFGESGVHEQTSAGTVAEILGHVYADTRTRVDWLVEGDVMRSEVKAALLAMLCAEQPLVSGGRISVTENAGGWRVTAQGPQIAPDPRLWHLLQDAIPDAEVGPAAVQFLLLPEHLARHRRRCDVQLSDTAAEIRF